VSKPTRASLSPKAAGVIHTDFQKGFIKAQVVSFGDLVEFGGEKEAQAAGNMTDLRCG
jgi:ribosome-binding ATPase YchF (GTP1/OBG family)